MLLEVTVIGVRMILSDLSKENVNRKIYSGWNSFSAVEQVVTNVVCVFFLC